MYQDRIESEIATDTLTGETDTINKFVGHTANTFSGFVHNVVFKDTAYYNHNPFYQGLKLVTNQAGKALGVTPGPDTKLFHVLPESNSLRFNASDISRAYIPRGIRIATQYPIGWVYDKIGKGIDSAHARNARAALDTNIKKTFMGRLLKKTFGEFNLPGSTYDELFEGFFPGYMTYQTVFQKMNSWDAVAMLGDEQAAFVNEALQSDVEDLYYVIAHQDTIRDGVSIGNC
ncbi:MAG: hypothetical protein NT079_00620, partial [Candidatus Omnitrophica bacterium]|nr:hypothetical protein [Candidatus Omnitrophota bacterium]